MSKEFHRMANSLCKIAAALALLSGMTLASALASAPAFASEFSQAGEFDGSYDSIGLGVSSLSDVEVNPGPFNAGVYVSPDIAFGPPLASDTVPEEGWAPIEPQIELSAGSY
jgi:hypothetical protein